MSTGPARLNSCTSVVRPRGRPEKGAGTNGPGLFEPLNTITRLGGRTSRERTRIFRYSSSGKRLQSWSRFMVPMQSKSRGAAPSRNDRQVGPGVAATTRGHGKLAGPPVRCHGGYKALKRWSVLPPIGTRDPRSPRNLFVGAAVSKRPRHGRSIHAPKGKNGSNLYRSGGQPCPRA